jgi:hypothetical protein
MRLCSMLTRAELWGICYVALGYHLAATQITNPVILVTDRQ